MEWIKTEAMRQNINLIKIWFIKDLLDFKGKQWIFVVKLWKKVLMPNLENIKTNIMQHPKILSLPFTWICKRNLIPLAQMNIFKESTYKTDYHWP